jgi:NTP pyrophosphatase (non-canonical NTP hydrolase)
VNEPQTLDDWYKLLNSIYIGQNYYRSVESVLAHIFEVSGGLSVFQTEKQKPGVDPKEFLAKTLGWWMALCGKIRIRSIEKIIWTKFPYVCPYCRLLPHNPYQCKSARKKSKTIEWKALQQIARDNIEKKPRTLSEWQIMFNDIYPRSDPTAYHYNFGRLAEELGELAEAVRLLPVSHSYFMNEAADVFAWLMGQANQIELLIASDDHEFGAFMTQALLKEYPSKCRVCSSRVCKCPPITSGSIERLAREMPTDAFPDPRDSQLFSYPEALDYFRIQEEAIVVENRRIELSLGVLEDFAKANKELRMRVAEQSKLQSEAKENLIQVFSQLEVLASSQQLTQTNVDEALTHLRSLPSEPRSVLLEFLNGMASGIWVEVLLNILKPR